VELKKDNRPIFIFGLSAGGMLAYHAAAISQSVKGVIATNLLDQRNQKVRDYSSGNMVLSRVGIPILKIISRLNGSFMLPMKAVANMKAIVNNIKMLRILLHDKTASGTKVPVRFITSLIEAKPAIEPEMFDLPLLLVHPEVDEWTPVFISEIFFSRIKGKKELKILNNAGHFPIEKPGIDQLPKYVQDFINQNLL
jgi:alpha-beta hydrolase superfamily lysophospholipase